MKHWQYYGLCVPLWIIAAGVGDECMSTCLLGMAVLCGILAGAIQITALIQHKDAQ